MASSNLVWIMELSEQKAVLRCPSSMVAGWMMMKRNGRARLVRCGGVTSAGRIRQMLIEIYLFSLFPKEEGLVVLSSVRCCLNQDPTRQSVAMLGSMLSIESRGWLQVNPASISMLPVLLAFFWLGLHVTYNRYFHPLRHFPGPFWGSITDIYNTYLFGTSRNHLKMLHVHKRYGG